MPTKHQHFVVAISKRYEPMERVAIAQDIIDYVRKRTKKGLNVDDKPWKGKAGRYSKEYQKSLDWRIAKKRAGTVNLTLSGDMLGALTLLSESKGKLDIGFEDGSDENARADGNDRGTYGTDSPIPGKARPFVGISTGALDKILSRYPLKDREKSMERAQKTALASDLAEEFLDIDELTT